MAAQENKKLDWIERIVGKKPYMIKPGVYVREIDLSEKVSKRFGEIHLDNPFDFERNEE